MKRIIIAGNNGAGKSTFADKLGKKLPLPVIHLDDYFHNEKGQRLSKTNWDILHAKLISQPAWIMDGTYARTLKKRLFRADTIIFLDYPRLFCLYRTFKRRLIEGSKGRLYLRLVKKVIFFPRKKLLKLLLNSKKDLIILNSPEEIKQYLAQF